MSVTVTSKQSYMSELYTLVGAGVPLIATHTREPHKAFEALETFVQHQNYEKVQGMNKADKLAGDKTPGLAFGYWTCTTGWTVRLPNQFVYDREDLESVAKVTANGVMDPGKAFSMLVGRGPQEQTPLPDGIYAILWPQKLLENTGVCTLLLEMATRFQGEINKKLVLILPEATIMPPELQDFITFLDYKVPSDEERVESKRLIFESHGQDFLSADEEAMISSAGAGMTSFELENSISRAVRRLKEEKKAVTGENIAYIVLKNKTEMVKRSEVLEIMEPGKMEDIGGLDVLKEWIRQRRSAFTPEAAAFGVDKPSGIAIGSAPGLGKSLCAKAVGHEMGLPVVRFDVSKVFGSLVGESEKKTRTSLALVEAMAPCVVLIDEVDKAFDTGRGGGDGGVGSRVLGSILTFMQESKAPVFWIMTFNRAQGLPPELLRKGRLDEVFSISLPNAEERKQILEIHLRKRKQDPSKVAGLENAVKASEGYVAAELEAAVKDAVLHAFNNKVPVSGELVAEQFQNMKPLKDSFGDQFEAMDSWAKNNARPASKYGHDAIESPLVPAMSTGNTITTGKKRIVKQD